MNGGARRALAFAAAALLASGLASCVDDHSSRTTDPPATAPATQTAVSDPTPTQDPGPSVGPRTEALRNADILVFSKETLTDEMVARIRKVHGVRSVERLSMAQVSVENRAINIAAVDPATYRLYTPEESANLQEQWQRVAEGQLALVKGLKRLVPDDGRLQLGSAADAPRVVVGAYAPQFPQIQAVVSQEIGEQLGMEPDNALIVAAYPRQAPEALRKPIARIVGHAASVQRVDIAARLGLDIHARQTAYLVGSVGDAVGIYNYRVLPGGRLIQPEASWVRSHISTQEVPILGSVTCNSLIFPQLRAALQEIVDDGLAGQIHPDEYAGCYYPRFIAGSTTLSNHAFGLALDLNARGNQRGTVGEMDRRVVAIFEQWGFTWGGHWHYTDPMHFEANAIVNPG
ncbi:M15 family metallopeptidase [Nocardioides agariphilus]|uniref:M15 family metallopeptidase n=1 Tax=Nocardioides agariphilus TaxID=433664 RepID=A0A930VPU3_9ACTN|nr:M15 family metallopeptidase [Nocardioides agariphilus]